MTLSQNGIKRNASTDEHGSSGKELKIESLLCKLKYQNNLPELPFDSKFLSYHLEPSRFLQYVATSLERSYKHELLTETDVGVEVDLIDADVFKIDKTVAMHPDDERLLEDEALTSVNARKSRHQKSVSWLRKTEYISTELYNRWNKSEKVESKLGYSVKRHLNEETVYRDRDSQIQAIESTFKAAAKPIHKHYSKPNVHAVEVLPIFPDFTLWRYPCAQVIFDDDPTRKQKSNTDGKDEVNQAMIRGMVDESGDHFVAYFLPTDQTKELRQLDEENRIPYTEGAPYEYELTREYNWNVKNKTMANYEENYFFVFRKDGVYYNELETRVRLSKRRKVNSQSTGTSGPNLLQVPKTRLIVHHRDFTDDELKAQTDRLYMLEHDVEEEDDDDEIEDGEENVDHDEDGEGESTDSEEQEQHEDDKEEVSGGSRKRSRRQSQTLDLSEAEDGNEQEDADDLASDEEEEEATDRHFRRRPSLSSSDDIVDDDEEEEEAPRSRPPPPKQTRMKIASKGIRAQVSDDDDVDLDESDLSDLE